jgi:hypothetical protein
MTNDVEKVIIKENEYYLSRFRKTFSIEANIFSLILH